MSTPPTPPFPAPNATPPEPALDVIRHEERLLVSTQRYATERVRVERVVVTEQRTITLDVRREEIRLIREALPETEPLPPQSASDRSEPLVIVLREEQLIITRAVVPVERVTLALHTITEERSIAEHLRREQITLHTSRTTPRATEAGPRG